VVRQDGQVVGGASALMRDEAVMVAEREGVASQAEAEGGRPAGLTEQKKAGGAKSNGSQTRLRKRVFHRRLAKCPIQGAAVWLTVENSELVIHSPRPKIAALWITSSPRRSGSTNKSGS
jgi:hypothetical protein